MKWRSTFRAKIYIARSPPFVRQDGGGLNSCGDWSHPPSKTSDVFQVLRQHWIHQIISQRLDKQLTHHFQNRIDSPPFSEEQLRPFKLWLEEFLEANGEAANWTIPADQPMHLFILHRVFSELRKIKTLLSSGISLKVFLPASMQPLNHLTVFRSTLMSRDRILL